MVQEVFEDDDRIEAVKFEGLLVDLAQEIGAHFVVRGLRAVSDYEYEFEMAQMNRELWSGSETVFLTPNQQYSFLSASLVREFSRLGGDVSAFFSDPVLRRLPRGSARARPPPRCTDPTGGRNHARQPREAAAPARARSPPECVRKP